MAKKIKNKDRGKVVYRYSIKDEDKISNAYNIMCENMIENLPTDAETLKDFFYSFREYSRRALNVSVAKNERKINIAYKKSLSILQKVTSSKRTTIEFNTFYKHEKLFDFEEESLMEEISHKTAIYYLIRTSINMKLINSSDFREYLSLKLESYCLNHGVTKELLSYYNRAAMVGIVSEVLGYTVLNKLDKKKPSIAKYSNVIFSGYIKAIAEKSNA